MSVASDGFPDISVWYDEIKGAIDQSENGMTSEIPTSPASWIQRRPNVCGGDACVRDTRIPVWSIVQAHRLGTSADELRTHFVTPLSAADVKAALEYYAQHAEEIENDIRLNEEA